WTSGPLDLWTSGPLDLWTDYTLLLLVLLPGYERHVFNILFTGRQISPPSIHAPWDILGKMHQLRIQLVHGVHRLLRTRNTPLDHKPELIFRQAFFSLLTDTGLARRKAQVLGLPMATMPGCDCCLEARLTEDHPSDKPGQIGIGGTR
ncbi:MAG: hypothetical protein TQ37_04985, partial [Candidatus Synechococcus spongiarum 15L]